MEDTVVLKQHYMYMFRVDLEDNNEDQLMVWFEKYHICNWLGKHEIGEKTGKPHYQMVVWSEHVKTNKNIVAMRKYWTDRLGKGTCAIKSAKKLESLCGYSTKSIGKLITNLPPQVLTRIPKWKNKTAEKINFNDSLATYIKDNDLAVYNKREFCIRVLDFYREHNRRPLRNNIQYLMWKYEVISSSDLVTEWRIVENNEYNNYN